MRHLILAILLLGAVTGRALAQTSATGSGYATFYGGYQAAAAAFQESITVPKYVESEIVKTTYDVANARGIDVGGGMLVWQNLAVGVALTRFSQTSAAPVAVSIPHPFFFKSARQISGDANVRHQETAVHIHAAWVAPVGERVQVMVFGGPSIFNVKQGFVTDVTFTDTYPYDAPAFGSATVEEQSNSKLGMNVGADVSFMFVKNVGIGVGVRFSRATATFNGKSGQTISVDAGGTQVGAGLRIRFD